MDIFQSNDADKIDRPFSTLGAFIVLSALAIVAYSDFRVQTVSLGYLYVLPLALSAFVFRLRISLGLAVVCVVFADWFGPFEHTGRNHVLRNLETLMAFIAVVIVVNRLMSQRARLAELVRRQRDELRREIELAAQVQQRLLPANSPAIDGFDIAGKMIAARTVGGDYFDYIELPNGDWGLGVADVSGKGLAAALLMSCVETALRIDAQSGSRANQIVHDLNRVLAGMTYADRYVTLFYGKLKPADRLLEYSNAGHPPPLLMRRDGAEVEWLGTGGTPAGLFAEAHYESGTVQLQPGDTIVFYTDGITEATNGSGQEFSAEFLAALVRENAESGARDLVEVIIKSVREFCGSSNFEDDLTVVVLKAVNPSA